MDAVFRRGDSGPPVAEITALLARIGTLPESRDDGGGVFDERVERGVRAFQQQRGLTVDGLVGPLTYRRLQEARWRLGDRILTHLPGDLMVGDDVYALQQRLVDLGFSIGRVDGYFGADTAAGVREFQRNFGIPPDGTCGPATLKALARLRPMVSGGAPNTLRVQEWIRQSGPNLGGRTVVLDVGRDDTLPEAYADRAAEILHDVAARVEGRLVAVGVQAFLSAPRWASPPPERERADFANRTGADLFVSLALEAASSPAMSGVCTYFFGDEDRATWSAAGERFAGLVQREIVARTDLVDLRSHPKTWELLRHTRMPAVRLDPGYLTNAEDAARLDAAPFRDLLAEAIVVAVQRFYLPPEVDSSTGVLQVSEIRGSFSGP